MSDFWKYIYLERVLWVFNLMRGYYYESISFRYVGYIFKYE